MQLPPLTLYIHYPWCVKKCPYCDFNSHTISHTKDDYIAALLADLEADKKYIAGRSLEAIFIGGGTPSLMSGDDVDRLITGIKEKIQLTSDIEITLESNPYSADMAKFANFKQAGVNRLSIGVQSFNDRLLQKIGRIHNANEAKEAIKIAQNVGFDNFNIDLMFGLETQTQVEILTDIKTAMTFNPNHISLYQLTIEPNTLFYKYPPKLPSSDSIYSAEQAAKKLLKQYGYQQYEVSAYAKANNMSKHNLNYWQFGDYLGIGAGAHSKITLINGDIIRGLKLKSPKDYLTNQQGKYQKITNITFEFMLNALRLKNGFDKQLFNDRTNLSIKNINDKLINAQNMGLLTIDSTKITPSNKGFDFLNDLQSMFL